MIDLQPSPASTSGEALRIPAAAKAGKALLTATIQITRASTGKVEEYTLVGTPLADTQKEI
jgi:transcription elongation GreA/GreB family factor